MEYLTGAGAILTISIAVFVWRWMGASRREARFAQARRDFHTQRERLEAKFVQLASAESSPRAPHWDDCDFDDDVAYVRKRKSSELWAFVAVTVATEDFTGPPAGIGDLIGSLRTATAVFRFERDHWETDGRAILNLSPAEAIRVFRDDLVVVGQELAGQS